MNQIHQNFVQMKLDSNLRPVPFKGTRKDKLNHLNLMRFEIANQTNFVQTMIQSSQCLTSMILKSIVTKPKTFQIEVV